MPPTVLALVLLWQQPATLEIGSPQQGSIAESSPEVHTETLDSNYTTDVTRGLAFQFAATQSGPHYFDLNSPAFDAYLVLAAIDGTVLAEDDDGLLATQARITWELEAGKTYLLQTCALHGQTGPFTLNIQLGQPIQLTEAQHQERVLADNLERISYLESLHGSSSLVLSDEINKLGVLHYRQGNYPDAIAAFKRVVAIRIEEGDSKYPSIFKAILNLSNTYVVTGDYENALHQAKIGLDYCQQALAEGHPETAYCQTKIGDILVAMGREPDAVERYEIAYKIYKSAPKEYAQDKIITVEALAEQLSILGKYEEALECYQDALELRRQNFPKGSSPIAIGLSSLGGAYSDFGELQKAKNCLLEAVEIQETIDGPNGKSVCIELCNLATVLSRLGEYDEALLTYQRGIAIAEELFPPNTNDYATVHSNYGGFLKTIGRYEEAIEELSKAKRCAVEQNGEGHILVLIIEGQIAATKYEMGAEFKAEQAFLENLRGFEKHYGPDHPSLIDKLLNFGSILVEMGRIEAAEIQVRRGLEIAEKSYGANHFEVARPLKSLSDILAKMDRYEEARILSVRAYEINKSTLGENHPDVADVMMELAAIHKLRGDYEIALGLYQRSASIMENSLGVHHPRTAGTYGNLGLFLESQGNSIEGKVYYRKSIESYQASGRSVIDLSAVKANLAYALAVEGQFQEARRLAEESLNIALELGGEDHRYSAYAMGVLASILLDQGDNREAENLYRRSLAAREKIWGPEHSVVALANSNLARVMSRQGKIDEAIQLERKALEIRKRVYGPENHVTAQSIHNLAAEYGKKGTMKLDWKCNFKLKRFF
jgi:tetratricopeptide (TPR) repeat protein